MLDQVSGGHHIFRLDRSTHQWVATGVALAPRPTSHADALWDNATQKLYVASRIDLSPTTSSSNPGRLWRFSYNPIANTYTLDAGFPVAINNNVAETLTIAKDSTGNRSGATTAGTWTSRHWSQRTRSVGRPAVLGRPHPPGRRR